MAANNFMFDVAKHMSDALAGAREVMNKDFMPSGTGPGIRRRSNQEQAALWRKMTQLPPEEMGASFKMMAERANHSDTEETPCELCTYVTKYGLGID